MKISIYIIYVFTFYFIIIALTSSTSASLTLAITAHWFITTTIHSSYFAIISSPFSSLLISFYHLFYNFYINSKRNSKLSLTLISRARFSLVHINPMDLTLANDILRNYILLHESMHNDDEKHTWLSSSRVFKEEIKFFYESRQIVIGCSIEHRGLQFDFSR